MKELDDEKKYFKAIKKRDNFECQNPECRNRGKGKPEHLAVHYIDYDKKNINPWNLITLCLGCRVETRYKKEYCQYVYEEIVSLKYPNDWEHLSKKRIKINQSYVNGESKDEK